MTAKKATCGAKTRAGGKCGRPAGWGTEHPGEGKCKLHGGATPRGAKSPHFKHGLYSDYLPPSIHEKAQAMQGQIDVIDLLPELSLMRALLADYMNRLKLYPQTSMIPYGDMEAIRSLTDQIRRLVDSIVRQRNDTALTAVEITFLVTRIPEVVVRFIDDPEKQRAFIAELFSITGGAAAGIGAARNAPVLSATAEESD